MAERIEFLMQSPMGRYASPMLTALLSAASADVSVDAHVTHRVEAKSDVLVLWGVGANNKNAARAQQRANGGLTFCWDLPYFGRHLDQFYTRVSIDHEHPQALLDRTPHERSRFDALEITLRNDYNQDGHIVLAALGRKSRRYLGPQYERWEARKFDELRRRFPGVRIIYRPKPTNTRTAGWHVPIDCETDFTTPIEQLLRGCRLVVSRHSNVSIDAIVAGVPYETEDGAACWLLGKPFTNQNRIDFLSRICWWQWRVDEAAAAWKFLMNYTRAYLRRVKVAA